MHGFLALCTSEGIWFIMPLYLGGDAIAYAHLDNTNPLPLGAKEAVGQPSEPVPASSIPGVARSGGLYASVTAIQHPGHLAGREDP